MLFWGLNWTCELEIPRDRCGRDLVASAGFWLFFRVVVDSRRLPLILEGLKALLWPLEFPMRSLLGAAVDLSAIHEFTKLWSNPCASWTDFLMLAFSNMLRFLPSPACAEGASGRLPTSCGTGVLAGLVGDLVGYFLIIFESYLSIFYLYLF